MKILERVIETISLYFWFAKNFFHLLAILKLWTHTLLEKTTRQIAATEDGYSITRKAVHVGWRFSRPSIVQEIATQA